MLDNGVGDGPMRSAADLVEAYGRSLVLAREIGERQAELAGLEAVIGPRRDDPTFMALLHMLAGASSATFSAAPVASAFAGPSFVDGGEHASSGADGAGKAKRRSPDRRGPFENGYGLGASAAREGKPREIDGLKKGWRFRGFMLAYDRVKAGSPLDVSGDFRATLVAMGEPPDGDEHASSEAPAHAVGGDGACAPSDGVVDSGFLAEDDPIEGPGDADDSPVDAGALVAGDPAEESHLPGWSADPVPSAHESRDRFPFDLPASEEVGPGHDLFQGRPAS